MTKFSCFSVIVRRKKKVKGDDESSKAVEVEKAMRTLRVRFQLKPVKTLEVDGLKPAATLGVLIPYGVHKKTTPSGKVTSPKSPVGCCEAAYEEDYEHEECPPLVRETRNVSDHPAHEAISSEDTPSRKMEMGFGGSDLDGRVGHIVQSGHLSDPGIGKPEVWGSPKLKRSCSNLETHNVVEKKPSKLPLSRSWSYEELQELAESVRKDVNPGSPGSVITHFSADKVMLKKHSSSQVLPSRSRKLWWKLFLWSHRNLHSAGTAKPKTPSTIAALNKQGGYSSDTLEPNRAMQFGKMESPLSYTGESLNIGQNNINDNQSWDGFHIGASGLWPQNQWVAFSAEASSSARVQEWVKDLTIQPLVLDNEDDHEGFPQTPPSPQTPDTGRSSSRSPYFTRGPDNEDTLHANTLIQSLNSSSTVAHISYIGLKAVPNMSCFCSLRSVNLSNNFIVHITPGLLPKSLHTLNLSKNKISTIEGLRDLTRLRVLDLSYNRICRIGRGLSNCNLIKELYLAGNKISDMEGLHRLLKLTVLDLSFNRITTTKALGQLVANYNSVQALNLLGNPIENNIGDEQLGKAVTGLLPKLAYLNKQTIKPQRAREAVTDSVAKAALGKGGRNPRRKASKKLSPMAQDSRKDSISPRKNASMPTRGHKSSPSVGQKSFRKSKSLAKGSLALPSSSH